VDVWNSPALENAIRLRKQIRDEIDRKFDPFKGWLPSNIVYEDSIYPTYDYEAEQAYEQAGFDLMQIASQNQDNPMKDSDWINAGVSIDYIYSKGVRGKPPGHQFFLNYMGRDINNPSNYESNYLNALMITHDQEVKDAKQKYYKDLLSVHGSLQGAWEFLQMTIDVAGPSD
jgi:hypothetical protein